MPDKREKIRMPEKKVWSGEGNAWDMGVCDGHNWCLAQCSLVVADLTAELEKLKKTSCPCVYNQKRLRIDCGDINAHLIKMKELERD